eukprot:5317200-Ditylum_brightwellii.AAC.1
MRMLIMKLCGINKMQQQQKRESIESGYGMIVLKKERSSQQSSKKWKVINDIHEDEPVDNEDVGVKGFDFIKVEKETGCISLLKLLIHLWPGNWQEQLKKINLKIKLDNTMKRER